MDQACRRIAPLLDVFGDGELPADRVLDVEQHLVDCEACGERVRFDAAVKASVRRAVSQRVQPSPAFQARLVAALAAERAREARADERDEPANVARPLRWRLPLAAAAAAGVIIGPIRSAQSPEQPARFESSLSTASSVDQLIDEFVQNHAKPLAPAVTEPSLIPQMEPEVGVPVRMPRLHQYGAHWEGGSVLPTPKSNRRAASFRYRLDGHRVTLYVYDSQRFPLRATLEPRVVLDQPVYVGNRQGYTLAAVEKRGVGYAVTTDLNDRESAELVLASMH
jgi:anti-sigma factor RsiW